MVPPGQVVCVTASGQPGRGFKSAVMPKVKHFLAFLQLVTSAASCHNSRTENDSLVNYWPRHLILIFKFTWNGLPICGLTSNLAKYKFPIFSMVYKPTWIIFGYITNWITNNSSRNLLDLIWLQNHGERASQILIVNNYAPIGLARNEIS